MMMEKILLFIFITCISPLFLIGQQANSFLLEPSVEIVDDFISAHGRLRRLLLHDIPIMYRQGKKEEVSLVLDKVIDNISKTNVMLYPFLERGKRYLNQKQLTRVRHFLIENLCDKNKYYERLIYIYGLRPFIPDLKLSLDSLTKQEVYSYFHKNRRFSSDNRSNLMKMLALANLDQLEYEEEILWLVDTCYVSLGEDHIGYLDFFNVLVGRTLGSLNTKSSVVKTLYLLDDEKIYPEMTDTPEINFAYSYFIYVVCPKIKLEGLHPMNTKEFFDQNRNDLKSLILEKAEWKVE